MMDIISDCQVSVFREKTKWEVQSSEYRSAELIEHMKLNRINGSLLGKSFLEVHIQFFFFTHALSPHLLFAIQLSFI